MCGVKLTMLKLSVYFPVSNGGSKTEVYWRSNQQHLVFAGDTLTDVNSSVKIFESPAVETKTTGTF